MDTSILRKANLLVRKRRPFFSDEKICDVFCSNDLIEIGFLSRRCSRDMLGSCMMCDYGAARDTYSIKAYLDEMDRILEFADHTINILLLCTNGSFFDHSRIDHDLFCAILERAGRCKIPVIEIETHYQDVTQEKLELLIRADAALCRNACGLIWGRPCRSLNFFSQPVQVSGCIGLPSSCEKM